MTRSLFLAVTLPGCVAFVDLGPEAVEERELEPFDAIVNEAAVDVIATVGEGPARLTCPEALLNNIITEVRGGTLEVRVPSFSVRSGGPCTLEVLTPSLSAVVAHGAGRIDLLGSWGLSEVDTSGAGAIRIDRVESASFSVRASGAGGVRIDELVSEDIVVDSSGAGRVEAAGLGRDLNVDASGAGSVDMGDLEVAFATVRLSGAGRVTVQATDRVEGVLSGAGSLVLVGDPAEVDVRTEGVGQVIR